jgi:choline kinase
MQLIILASGKGSRLGKIHNYSSKLFLKIYKKITTFDYLHECFSKFKETIIVLGFKYHVNKEKILKKNKKIKIVRNKKYKSTNMVESLFLTKKTVNSDIVILYSDVIFDLDIIYQIIKIKGSLLPINTGWLRFWKLRMNYNKIKKDAEDLKINNKYIISLGGKLKKKFPIGQFMGILKLSLKDFKKLYIFYKILNNKKIQMTHFLNLALEKKIIKLKYKKFNKFWVEIDSKKDYFLSKKLLNNVLHK